MRCLRKSWKYFRALATVAKLNVKTVVVTLNAPVVNPGTPWTYPAGQKIKVPRFVEPGWSVNNAVRPAPGIGVS